MHFELEPSATVCLTISQDERRMAKYMQYAVAATEEALDDSNWHPQNSHEQARTVR